jgi:hypothetical protein
VIAEIFPAAETEGACAVGAADPRDAHAGAFLLTGAARVNDFGDDLMAWNDPWQSRWQLAFDDMEIGVAYAAREHFEQNLIVHGHGHGKLFDVERVGVDGSRRPENGCAHGIPPFVCMIGALWAGVVGRGFGC